MPYINVMTGGGALEELDLVVPIINDGDTKVGTTGWTSSNGGFSVNGNGYFQPSVNTNPVIYQEVAFSPAQQAAIATGQYKLDFNSNQYSGSPDYIGINVSFYDAGDVWVGGGASQFALVTSLGSRQVKQWIPRTAVKVRFEFLCWLNGGSANNNYIGGQTAVLEFQDGRAHEYTYANQNVNDTNTAGWVIYGGNTSNYPTVNSFGKFNYFGRASSPNQDKPAQYLVIPVPAQALTSVAAGTAVGRSGAFQFNENQDDRGRIIMSSYDGGAVQLQGVQMGSPSNYGTRGTFGTLVLDPLDVNTVNMRAYMTSDRVDGTYNDAVISNYWQLIEYDV